MSWFSSYSLFCITTNLFIFLANTYVVQAPFLSQLTLQIQICSIIKYGDIWNL